MNTTAMGLLKVVLVLLVGWCAAAPAPLPAQSSTNNASSPAAATHDGDPHVRQKRSFHSEPPVVDVGGGGGGGGGVPVDFGPPASGPPASGPPGSGPPASGPPASGPPASGPPASGPPASGPPASGPPASGPPASGPPTSGPPTSGPPTFGLPISGPPISEPSSSISPYFADPQGRPAPPPPTLGQELTPPPLPCPHMETTCDHASPYRTFNGRCNNLQHPDFGAVGHSFITLLPPTYDAPAVFRTKSVRGGLLPNPRLLSLLLRHTPEGHKQPVNALFVQIGQLVDHDFGITTVFGSGGGSTLNCRLCSSWVSSPCVPIPIPVNDPYMPAFTQGSSRPRCLPFTRSVAHLTRDAQGRRSLHQPNINTAFIDMSPIYGNDACTSESLRRHRDGKLKSDPNHMLTRRPAREFPSCRSDDGHCYLSGDLRANENVGLTVLHVVVHRAHNQLAEALKGINPHWDDEQLFQEARRINVARFQNLVHREYVPTLLGYHTAAKRQLIPHHEGYFLDYNATVNPAIYNEFTTAAFRMGHSQVPKYFYLLDEHYQVLNYVPLFQTFFNTTLLAQPGTFDPLVRGLMGVSLRPTDLSFINDLNNKLFIKMDDPLSGHDLFAINIVRGRDHGLAPYVMYLSRCGIKEVTSFADLESLMPLGTVDLLSKAYADVRDIDLYVGGLSELPMPGALVGPTFSCIITRQFITAKIGDRFWFEGPDAGFTLDQLQTLRQTSLASLLCEAMDHHDPLVPAQAFYLPDQQSNPLRRCSELPKINLELWREVPFAPPTPCRHLGDFYQAGRPMPVSPCLVCVCQRDGEVWCRCNLSGCSQAPRDYHCRRICGHTAPSPQPQYPQ